MGGAFAKLAESGLIPLDIGMAGTFLRQEAGRDCLHSCVAEQSSPT